MKKALFCLVVLGLACSDAYAMGRKAPDHARDGGGRAVPRNPVAEEESGAVRYVRVIIEDPAPWSYPKPKGPFAPPPRKWPPEIQCIRAPCEFPEFPLPEWPLPENPASPFERAPEPESPVVEIPAPASGGTEFREIF